jgi:hypothetical protein
VTRWDYALESGQEVLDDAVLDGTVEPRLLPGEDPNTELLEDVTHWVSVYTELLDSGWGLVEDGSASAPETDEQPMQAHLRRIEGRLDFWLQKRAQMTS